eukprot:2813937-Rhodomonas_salina.5
MARSSSWNRRTDLVSQNTSPACTAAESVCSKAAVTTRACERTTPGQSVVDVARKQNLRSPQSAQREHSIAIYLALVQNLLELVVRRSKNERFRSRDKTDRSRMDL